MRRKTRQIRVGVNSGSLDPDIAEAHGGAVGNAKGAAVGAGERARRARGFG